MSSMSKWLAPEWHRRAACLDYPGNKGDFFAEEDSMTNTRLALRAKTFCQQECPVLVECFEEAMTVPQWLDVGVRGGTSAKDRRAIRRAKSTMQREAV